MATGADSLVVLRAATILGGTLDSAEDGEIQLLNGTASFLDGSGDAGAVGNDGTVRLQYGMIAGEFANRDTLTFFTSGTAQFLVSTVGVTLTGGGNVTMLGTAGAESRIIGENGTDTSHLVNEDNTIQGGGYIGSAPSGFETNLLTLENGTNGTIRATVLETLIIDTSGAIENDGTLSASGGTLDIRDDITGPGALAASFGGTLLLRGDWTGDVAFSGATAETLGHTANSSWVSGSVVTLSGMGTGDKVDLGFTTTLDIDSPNVFDWSQDGNDGTLDYFAIGGGTRSFVFEGLTQTHFSLENNGNSGVAFVRQSTIDGTDAANTLNGTTGDDRMVGFGGNDTFKGTVGDDIFDGTDGNDTADYSGATGGVTVNLAVANVWQSVGGGQGKDLFRFIESVTGSRFADRLAGDTRVNRIDGGSGNDTLTGTGNDTVLGGAGNDTFILNSRGDRISDASGTDHVKSAFSYTLGAGFDSLTLTGSGAFNGTGNSLRNVLVGNNVANTLSGGGAKDTLNGSGGNDILVGGAAADRYTGGTGADRFQFKAKADSTVAVGGRDTILDFVRSQGDRVDLTALDANLRKAGNQAFDFIGAKAFGGDAGELRFSKGSGSTLVRADINGDRKADFAFAFDDPLALIARDFLL
jgi:Ca2+-binding RTX toxin-like protein